MSAPTFGLLLALIAAMTACGGDSGAPPIQRRGEDLFARHCSSCHSLSPGTVIVGPSLAGVGERAADRSREWTLAPT